MPQTEAHGPEMYRIPPRSELLLEGGMEQLTAEVAALFAHARAIDPRIDEFGHARSRAYSDAVALLKVGAKLGHTVAELRGSKFEHTIRVRRENAAENSSAAPEEDNDSQYLWLGREKLFDWKNRRVYQLVLVEDGPPAKKNAGSGETVPPSPRDSDANTAPAQGARVLESADRPAATEPPARPSDPASPHSKERTPTPTPISRGSNGNSRRAADSRRARADIALATAGPSATQAQREAAGRAMDRTLARLEADWTAAQRKGFGRHTPSPIPEASNGNFAERQPDRADTPEPIDDSRA